jgi:hypothetical protein
VIASWSYVVATLSQFLSLPLLANLPLFRYPCQALDAIGMLPGALEPLIGRWGILVKAGLGGNDRTAKHMSGPIYCLSV